MKCYLLAAGFPPLSSKSKQQGAVAIEFAAIFVLFFVMVYGIIAFGIPTAFRMGFQHYSAEAARAASIVPSSTEDYETRLGEKINTIISDSWLKEDWLKRCSDLRGDGWEPLLSSTYAFWREAPGSTNYQLNVCLETTHPIVPQIELFGIELPPFPKDANGNTVIRGYTITTL